jgi:hypothetical protein
VYFSLVPLALGINMIESKGEGNIGTIDGVLLHLELVPVACSVSCLTTSIDRKMTQLHKIAIYISMNLYSGSAGWGRGDGDSVGARGLFMTLLFGATVVPVQNYFDTKVHTENSRARGENLVDTNSVVKQEKSLRMTSRKVHKLPVIRAFDDETQLVSSSTNEGERHLSQ